MEYSSDTLCSIASRIGVDPSDADVALRMCMPVRLGGLGYGEVEEVAAAASAAGVVAAVDETALGRSNFKFLAHGGGARAAALRRRLAEKGLRVDAAARCVVDGAGKAVEEAKKLQRRMTATAATAERRAAMTTAAREMMALAGPEDNDAMTAMPTPMTLLTNREWAFARRRRLGAPDDAAAWDSWRGLCVACGCPASAFHTSMCQAVGMPRVGTLRRHTGVCNALALAAAAAGHEVRREHEVAGVGCRTVDVRYSDGGVLRHVEVSIVTPHVGLEADAGSGGVLAAVERVKLAGSLPAASAESAVAHVFVLGDLGQFGKGARDVAKRLFEGRTDDERRTWQRKLIADVVRRTHEQSRDWQAHCARRDVGVAAARGAERVRAAQLHRLAQDMCRRGQSCEAIVLEGRDGDGGSGGGDDGGGGGGGRGGGVSGDRCGMGVFGVRE